jgi:hypothetical protein
MLLPAILGLTTVLACGRDGGSRPTVPVVPPPGEVVITQLIPARTVVGDTVVVLGTGFGTTAGSATFGGAGGSRVAGQIDSWSDTQLRVLVPAGATDGPVGVRAGGVDSNTLAFSVAPRLISYASDLLPRIFANINVGCTGCHGGQNNLFLDTAQKLMRGDSNNGPVIIPRNSAGSILLRKVGPNPPFGSRMPFGGTPLSDVERLLIADWIDQGARNN